MKSPGIIACLLCCTLSVAGQEYTAEQLSAFTEVYFEQKTAFTPDARVIEKHLARFDITPERYGAILQARISGRRLTLTEKETACLEGITQIQQKTERDKDKRVRRICKRVNVDVDTYKDILHKYQTDLTFQRTLKPYFDNYLKQLHQ